MHTVCCSLPGTTLRMYRPSAEEEPVTDSALLAADSTLLAADSTLLAGLLIVLVSNQTMPY